jgi:hypothetical protein
MVAEMKRDVLDAVSSSAGHFCRARETAADGVYMVGQPVQRVVQYYHSSDAFEPQGIRLGMARKCF